MKKIAIYSEAKNGILDETAYELISKAYILKNFAKISTDIDIKITAIAVSNFINENCVQKAFSAGADSFVLVKNDSFNEFNQITYANAFLSYFHTNFHNYILFPATLTGRMVAPRITTILDTGLVADCTGLDFIVKDNDIKLASTRPTFGAELMATILSKREPECATVRPKTFKPEFKSIEHGEYIEFPCSITNNIDIKKIESVKENSNKYDLTNSKVIFCAGFGLYDGKENLYIKKLQEISSKIGVSFAISRKLVDYGILDTQYQIGQTGATVTPDLIVSFGVSGAIQHIQGMKNSKIIIAVNSDENAEIFKYSDYKIVADAKNIIDKLYECLFVDLKNSENKQI